MQLLNKNTNRLRIAAFEESSTAKPAVRIQTGGVTALFATLRILYRVQLRAPERLTEAE